MAIDPNRQSTNSVWFFAGDNPQPESPIFMVRPGFAQVLTAYNLVEGNGGFETPSNCDEKFILFAAGIEHLGYETEADVTKCCCSIAIPQERSAIYVAPLYNCDCMLSLTHKTPRIVITTPGQYQVRVAEGLEGSMLGRCVIEVLTYGHTGQIAGAV
jgi:hypothetical protein